MRFLVRTLLNFLENWFFNSVCLYACSRWMSGIELTPAPGVPVYLLVMELGAILTLLNALLRPILLRLLIPLNGITVGLFSLVINGYFILLLRRLSGSFNVVNIGTAIGATFVFAFLNMVLQILVPVDDDISYYSGRVQRAGKNTDYSRKSKGIVMLEIDGLSCDRLEHAVESGHMPFVKTLLESGSHTVRSYDCGIPSQTSSCQAGIMYGRNENICAFRWYDKENRRVFSSNNPSDAAAMEKNLFPDGRPSGILNNGLSVNNIISGNAEENIFTISHFLPADGAEQNKRNLDLYHFSLRPYLLTRSIILTIFDAIREVISYFWDRLLGKEPRLNRLRGFYPLVRGATNVLLRDLSTALVVDAIADGRESMYTTFIGYDEIAHHSGPDSPEAYRALTGIDRSIRKIFEAAEISAARPYDLVILSDHGQSFGATFKQRYGVSLGDTIKRLAVKHALAGKLQRVVSVEGSDDNNANVMAVLNVLGSDDRSSIVQQTYNNLENAIENTEAQAAITEAETQVNDILVLASGNLVNAYFQVSSEHLTLEQIDAAYPGLLTDLTAHPGIGIIAGQREDGPVALGKDGERNLYTGAVRGTDPLRMYGEPEKRAEQLRYLLEFPNVGDLVIISPVYEDGTVAAYEELIGSHGGLGGAQTDPFLVHPASVRVEDDIRNSKEVYNVLKRIKNAPLPKAKRAPKERAPEVISLKALAAQILNVRHWGPTFVRTLYFSPSAYQAIIRDPAYNGPALLIELISFISTWIAMNRVFAVYNLSPMVNFGILILIFAVEVAACYLTSLILRGKRNPWKLTRGIFFSSYWLVLLLGTLSGQVVLIWISIAMLLEVNALTACTMAAGELRARYAIPVFLSLVILIPLLWYAILLIYNFVIFTSTGQVNTLENLF